MKPLFPCRHDFQSSDERDVLQDNSWHAPPGFHPASADVTTLIMNRVFPR
jgi:hypothetical protein